MVIYTWSGLLIPRVFYFPFQVYGLPLRLKTMYNIISRTKPGSILIEFYIRLHRKSSRRIRFHTI